VSWLEPLIHRAWAGGGPAVSEERLVCVYRDGYAEETYLTASATRLDDEQGVLVGIEDCTARVLGARRADALRDVAGDATGAQTVAAACARALSALARHPEEIPFALLYLRHDDGVARLAAAAHLSAGGRASPRAIPLLRGAEADTWPVAVAFARNETLLVNDVLERFGPLPAGGWPFAPRCALLVPVACPTCDVPEGVLVAGMSARRAPDVEHRAFMELVAKQVGSVIAGGQVREDEANRALLRAAARRRDARQRAIRRALAARFAGALEERTRLAREIHDTLLQGVTAIALQLRAVLPRLDQSVEPAETVARILALAEHTSHEARQAVWDIRPSARSAADLTRALETLVARAVEGAGIDARLSVRGAMSALSCEQQVVILRVTQEAMSNVIRHARASVVKVRLAYGARQLTLTVSDNGSGFIISNHPQTQTRHFGLLGMRERAHSVGGALEVRSTQGVRTTVRLTLPYETASRSPALVRVG
jgi:signal transduction histidine kinase